MYNVYIYIYIYVYIYICACLYTPYIYIYSLSLSLYIYIYIETSFFSRAPPGIFLAMRQEGQVARLDFYDKGRTGVASVVGKQQQLVAELPAGTTGLINKLLEKQRPAGRNEERKTCSWPIRFFFGLLGGGGSRSS